MLKDPIQVFGFKIQPNHGAWKSIDVVIITTVMICPGGIGFNLSG
jgi:hypothetical protein